jgi:hypothetical protein
MKVLRSPEDLLPQRYLRAVLREVDRFPGRSIPRAHAVWQDFQETISQLRNIIEEVGSFIQPSQEEKMLMLLGSLVGMIEFVREQMYGLRTFRSRSIEQELDVDKRE